MKLKDDTMNLLAMRGCLIFVLCLQFIFLSCGDETNENIIPPPELILAESDLLDYERDLDHAGLMEEWSDEFYHKGMITYRNTCFNCHGDADTPGSIPHSTKFWQDSLKNGNDPLAMYKTMTRGFGLMPPQVNLTPREKYEVIHFVREAFMRKENPDNYFPVTDTYLNGLPKGFSKGPAPKPYKPWAEMDYGNFLINTYELSNSGDAPRPTNHRGRPIPNEDLRDANFAYKGIAIRLDKGAGGIAAGKAFVLFDHDLMRLTGFWTGEGFIDYEGILLNDRHNIYPRTVGQIQIENPIMPGWANPSTSEFKDPRIVAVDGRPFGPLPREWAHYKGLYYHGDRVIITYTVSDAVILESFELEEAESQAVLSRTLNMTPSSKSLTMRIAPEDNAVALIGDNAVLAKENGFHVMKIAAGNSAKVKLLMAASAQDLPDELEAITALPEDLSKYTRGGPKHDAQVLTSPLLSGNESDAYAVDVFVLPTDNPWKSRMRPTGIDFIEDGDQALVSTIDGEVWRLSGMTQLSGEIQWERIATGLFQPLGIKYHRGEIYVICRDQLVRLHDLNGDGETDFYESFNSDHQVTEHFHEFAMGLQVDKAGNFYYAKSARHARDALVPQHGTLLKVSADGTKTEIVAHGFRAANGVCINDDGTFIVTDQEGHWNPMNRINWVEPGGFYGNMYGYGAPDDSSDNAMLQPLCWIDSKYDRSPAELLWARSDRWGPLNGALLNLSYGYGRLFVVMPQRIGNIKQGGMVELPIPRFPTGVMRGRFNPKDGQLYAVGMSAWATSQMLQIGGIYRVRYTGKALNLPIKMAALSEGMKLVFASKLDKSSAENHENYTINTWDLKRSRQYGSDRYNLKEMTIENIELEKDGKTVVLYMKDIKPTWVMEILYDLKNTDGVAFEGAVQSTIYELQDNPLVLN